MKQINSSYKLINSSYKLMNACAVAFTFVCAEALRTSIKQRWTRISHYTFRHCRLPFIASVRQSFSEPFWKHFIQLGKLFLYITDELLFVTTRFVGHIKVVLRLWKFSTKFPTPKTNCGWEWSSLYDRLLPYCFANLGVPSSFLIDVRSYLCPSWSW